MASTMSEFEVGDEFQIKEKFANIDIGKKYIVVKAQDEKIYFWNNCNRLDSVSVTHTIKIFDDTRNNGGETDYYKIKEDWKTAQDIIEARKMNFAQGNIFKVAITFNEGRHQGTDYLRELNKMEYFIKREKKRITQECV